MSRLELFNSLYELSTYQRKVQLQVIKQLREDFPDLQDGSDVHFTYRELKEMYGHYKTKIEWLLDNGPSFGDKLTKPHLKKVIITITSKKFWKHYNICKKHYGEDENKKIKINTFEYDYYQVIYCLKKILLNHIELAKDSLVKETMDMLPKNFFNIPKQFK